MHFSRFTNTLRRSGTKLLILLAALALPLALPAQEAPKKELTEKVSESIQNINTLFTNKQFDDALRLIDSLLSQVNPNSFDTAYLSQLKAQVLLTKQDYPASIIPLETALRLSEQHKFFEPRQNLELLWMIAQLYVQDAGTEKNPEVQKLKYTKALQTVRRWLSMSPKPNADAYMYAASILYQQAMGQKEPDKALLKEAASDCNNALQTSIKPKETIYQLLIAIAQTTGELNKAAQYLELLLAANPKNSQYWNSLLYSYITSTENTPEGSFLRNEAYAKAVYTIKRAQAQGYMNTPEDNHRMVAMYVNSSQFEGAIDILEPGLKNGKIDASKYANWELLAQCYLQINDTKNAIRIFQEASKKFPTEGNIDMQIGNLYYNMEQYRLALDNMIVAARKGVSKPAPLYFFIAYLHLELKELEPALAAINKSLELNPNANDAKNLKQAIESSIEERDRNLKRDKEKAEQLQKQQAEQAAAQGAQPAAQPAQTKN